MNLERRFEKELAGDLREETKSKIQEIRKLPSSFDEIKKGGDFSFLDERPDIKEKIESIKKDIWGKLFKTEKFRENKDILNKELNYFKKYNIDSIKKEYNKKFQEILESNPLSEIEKKQYLSTESMEKMNLEDYLILLKRLSGEAFYHVTRYGVRENTFMSTGGGHTANEGNFINSLTPLLKDGYIKDATSTIISDRERAIGMINEERILDFKKQGKNVEEIVDIFIKNYDTDYPLDRESAHFSYGEDKHHMYGGENDYKFYFYYPVEYILENNFYRSNREGLGIKIGQNYFSNRHGIEQQYNDEQIFNFGKGVPINAGILCITGDIKVDPETGSQYKLENGVPIKDENGEFKKPNKTISSKEYWENYFNKNPELKPSKILYKNFRTISYKETFDLTERAKEKEIHTQDYIKKQEFEIYKKQKTEEIKKVFKEVIEQKYKEL